MEQEHPRDPAVCLVLSLFTLGLVRFFVVQQGFRRVILSFGRCVQVAEPGFHGCFSLWGIYRNLGPAVPASEQVAGFQEQGIFTSDGIQCNIQLLVCYSIVDPARALFGVSNFRKAIEDLVKSVVLSECGKRKARQVLPERAEMARGVAEALERGSEPWGIKVRIVEIKQIDVGV